MGPDLNPIEKFFSTLKSLLRKASARTIDGLGQVIAGSVSEFSPGECKSYVTATRYDS